MEDLLSKIFDKVAFYEKDGIQFGIEYDAQVEELLEPLRTTMSESDVEEKAETTVSALQGGGDCLQHATQKDFGTGRPGRSLIPD